MPTILHNRKREIIQKLLRHNILLDANLIEKLDQPNFLDEIEQAQNINNVNCDVTSNEERCFDSCSPPKKIKKEDFLVKTIWQYKDLHKKWSVQDFVLHFTKRYEILKNILMRRQELQNAVSFSRIKSCPEKESVVCIGLVYEKNITKNNNIIMTLEDPTGRIKILVSKSKQDLYNSAMDVQLDQVIGITGNTGKGIVFVNSLCLPDIPLIKELKKSPVEEYILFISDMHIGSKLFMKEKFDKFIKWLCGEIGSDEQKKIVKNIKYVFIAGDVVECIGVYPNQEKDLNIKDVYKQYSEFARLIDAIPKHISIIIGPGNHDAMRITEPQPPIYQDYAPNLYKMSNVFLITNPALVNVGAREGFPGFNILFYHGFSLPSLSESVNSVRINGGQGRVDLVLKYLLQCRHLAPLYGSTQIIPDPNQDPFVIKTVPDIFVTGHIHRASVSEYRNITILNASCWAEKTEYQEKFGIEPEPARAVLINLKTREVKLLKF